MSKKKKQRQASPNPDPFLDFDEEDYELDEEVLEMEADRYAFDERPFPREKERRSYREERFPFDFDRWRDNLTARSSNRERMRQRDLRKGILMGTRVRRLPLDPELLDEEDDE